MALYFLPIISAFIGWFTNWIAIKLLFHPREPKNILGFKLQGIFPKRQKQFAQKLGATVANELLHFNDIANLIKDPKNLSLIKPQIEKHINHFVEVKLPEKIPFISMLAGTEAIANITQGLMEEIELLLPELMDAYAGKLADHVNIEQMVTEKVANFSSDKLEDMLQQLMKKEFRFVEFTGAVLGFLIGMLQLLLTQLT